ncbi:MAG: hypothetical protein J0H14_07740 [Alphaproteobacteria bacterium]|nr:hypothetical protein [Alphaproteobacteria bacterium]
MRRRSLLYLLLPAASAHASTTDRAAITARYERVRHQYEALQRTGADLSSLAESIQKVRQAVRSGDLQRVNALLDQIETGLAALAAGRPGENPVRPPDDISGQAPGGGGGEYRVVQAIRASPAYLELVTARAPRVAPDGAVGRNIERFSDVAAQRDTIWLLLRGLATGSAEDVDATVRSLRYGFARQTDRGNFANQRGASDQKAVGVDAFFLQAFGRMYLLIAESPFSARFLPPLNALKPQLTRAMAWLAASRSELTRQDRHATNRLFFDALAFVLNGEILGDPSLRGIGESFIEAGLDNQRDDGTYNEHNGFDTSYQAVSILNVAGLLAHAPTPRLKTRLTESLRRAIAWERARVSADGRIEVQGNARTGLGQEQFLGKAKDVNYAEVALAFLYAAIIEGDPRLEHQGESIARYLAARGTAR